MNKNLPGIYALTVEKEEIYEGMEEEHDIDGLIDDGDVGAGSDDGVE